MTIVMRRLRRVRAPGDTGITLVETLIAMGLSLVVATLVTSAFTNTAKLFQATDAEYTGQADVRTTIERLGRDLRTARSVDTGASASQLVLWIDSNSDYIKQPVEIVTWKLTASADGHFDVTRLSAGATSRTARLVVSQIAFCYRETAAQTCPGGLPTPLSAADAKKVRLVSSDIEYDAVVDRGIGSRHSEFTERLRNVS